MSKQDHLLQHLELCKQIFERMRAENAWPWDDSQKSEDLVESEDTSDDI